MNPLFSLRNRVAVVTGGKSGIGLETVRRLRLAGASVVLADLRPAHDEAETTGAAHFPCDVSDGSQFKALFDFTLRTYGAVHILVNNAGVFSDYSGIGEKTEDAYALCHRVNVMGTAHGLKQAAKSLADGGSVINVASAAGVVGASGLADYAASKHAVVGLTRSAALELAARGIRVNCVCPTTVDTPMAHADGGEQLLAAEKLLVPLGRICDPREVAAAIHFLAAEDCAFINGQAITLDGGTFCGTSPATLEKLAS